MSIVAVNTASVTSHQTHDALLLLSSLTAQPFRFCQYHHMNHASRAQTSRGARAITPSYRKWRVRRHHPRQGEALGALDRPRTMQERPGGVLAGSQVVSPRKRGEGPPERAFPYTPEGRIRCLEAELAHVCVEVGVESDRSVRIGEGAGSTLEALLDVERVRRG